jgi:hypothetical protein
MSAQEGTSKAESEEEAPDVSDLDALQADVEETRRELGQTVDALAAKLDVKARTRARLDAGRQQVLDGVSLVRDQATDDNGAVRREVLIAAGVLAVSVSVIAVLVVRTHKG